jgi:RsmE family RNA methyltransferase
MNRILLAPDEIPPTGSIVLHDRRAVHIRQVLRAEPGTVLQAGIINGPRGTATVKDLGPSGVRLVFRATQKPDPLPRADLLLALPRPKVMKRLWAQLSALGIGHIILTNAWKVERNYFDTHILDPAVYRPLLIDGLQQAAATRLPRVSIHRRFKPLIEDQLSTLSNADLRIVAHPQAQRSINSTIQNIRPQRVLIATGPEGGWTPYELDLLGQHGFQQARLSSRILRSDTACIAILSVVHALLSA